jgi:hypothetical protein
MQTTRAPCLSALRSTAQPNNCQNQRTEIPLHTQKPVHHRAALWLGAILSSIALSPAALTTAHADETGAEGSPNSYNCLGHISGGAPEVGSSEQQVRYTFYCNGPITGYQLETNVPQTGFGASPLVTNSAGKVLSDTFSCGGELPGWADNCVGSAKLGWETVTGELSIGTSLCAEPRIDPVLTVTDIYLEKGLPTQAISGPFDLGRPLHCPTSAYKGGTRLNPVTSLPLKGKANANRHRKSRGKVSGAAGKGADSLGYRADAGTRTPDPFITITGMPSSLKKRTKLGILSIDSQSTSSMRCSSSPSPGR